MLKFLQYYYSALLFLRPHCSTLLSFFFIDSFLSLPCLSPSQVSSLSFLTSPLSHHLTQASSSPSHHLNQLFHHCNSENTQKIPERTPLQSHKNPTKKSRKNPTAITQKPNLKTKKSAHKNTQNLTENTQKISLQNPKNQLPNYQKVSFQNTQKG